MTNNVLASIIVLTYNSQKYIRQALNSIVQQKTIFPVEIIICDDASKDNTIDILHEYQRSHDKIKIFYNEKNLGIVANLQKAIDLSSGKYIAYCGHDDYWHDDLKIQKQVEFLENNPEYGLVHTQYHLLDEKTGVLIKNYLGFFHRIKIKHGEISEDLIKKYYIGSCTPCYRKDIFVKYVPINDLIRLQIPFEDIPAYFSISLHSKVGYLHHSTATFRWGHKSASNPTDIKKCEQFMEGWKRMTDYFYEKYPQKFGTYKNNYKILKCSKMLEYAYELKDFKKARFHALELKKHNEKSNQIFFANNVILFKLYITIRNNATLFKTYIILYRIKFHIMSQYFSPIMEE